MIVKSMFAKVLALSSLGTSYILLEVFVLHLCSLACTNFEPLYLSLFVPRSLTDALKSVFDNVHMQAELTTAQEQLVCTTTCANLLSNALSVCHFCLPDDLACFMIRASGLLVFRLVDSKSLQNRRGMNNSRHTVHKRF